MRQVRILLANSHPIIRSNLRLLLEREPGLQVVAEAANGNEAIVLADYRRPDIVVLDINLSHVNGIAAARAILVNNEQTVVIFVTSHPDEAYVVEALKAGARGYVVEDRAETDLVPAIQTTSTGRAFVSPCVRTSEIDPLGHGSAAAQRVQPPV